jgi:hypothetical protein
VSGWPSATGVGSLPGTDPHEAARVVLGELAELPFLPELPARGPHADLAGRGAALLVDLPVDLQPTGWRLVPRPSRDATRARDLLTRDLDALEEVAAGSAPPMLKVQATGPWTLAALLELQRGERVLADPGAVEDLAQSLAEGLTRHLADLSGRFPGSELVLQLDEPALPAVRAGEIPTSSGFGRLRVPTDQVLSERLATVLASCARTVVHCCAPRPPVLLLVGAGAGAVSVDAALLTPYDDDALGEAVEGGAGLFLGVVPSTDTALSDLTGRMDSARVLWRRLGFPHDRLPGTVVVTPSCGLAGATPGYAKAALGACAEIGRRLGEEPE